jgi:hypothetical protein
LAGRGRPSGGLRGKVCSHCHKSTQYKKAGLFHFRILDFAAMIAARG